MRAVHFLLLASLGSLFSVAYLVLVVRREHSTDDLLLIGLEASLIKAWPKAYFEISGVQF